MATVCLCHSGPPAARCRLTCLDSGTAAPDLGALLRLPRATRGRTFLRLALPD